MKLNIKALAIAIGVIWSSGVLLVGFAHMIWPAYGVAFLDWTASIYPGFHPGNGIGAVVVGAGYAFVDGVAGGAALAWLYNAAS